jgi:hypothetical protein
MSDDAFIVKAVRDLFIFAFLIYIAEAVLHVVKLQSILVSSAFSE